MKRIDPAACPECLKRDREIAHLRQHVADTAAAVDRMTNKWLEAVEPKEKKGKKAA